MIYTGSRGSSFYAAGFCAEGLKEQLRTSGLCRGVVVRVWLERRRHGGAEAALGLHEPKGVGCAFSLSAPYASPLRPWTDLEDYVEN